LCLKSSNIEHEERLFRQAKGFGEYGWQQAAQHSVPKYTSLDFRQGRKGEICTNPTILAQAEYPKKINKRNG